MEETIATLKLEKQSLLDRLSENASMKLKDGNPNITDLGDHNRPDKLAEQFSELYDNQWTDGFEFLTTNLKMKDKDAILSLLNIVQLIYETCLSKAESLEQQMHITLALYLGQEYKSKEDADYRAFREKVMYTIRDFRGHNFYMSMNDVRKDIKERLRENMDEKICKLCKKFITECSRVCWLMCIKNPPMHITSESGIVFNEDIYRSYTAKGPYIAYVVWPVLYLHKHGTILKKGVAQGEMKKPKSAKAEDNNRDHAKEAASLSPNSTSVLKRRNSDPFSVTHLHFKMHEVDTRRFVSISVSPKTPNKADGCPTVTPGFIKADLTLRKGIAPGKRKKTTSVQGKDSNRGPRKEVESSNSTSVDKVLYKNDLKYKDKEVSDVRILKRRNSDPLSVKYSEVHDVDTS
ncbi:hypothetical protein CHS0354_004207 [Potamilus streckersoni]|nr:hypothetical protein CHS0354_004207 [Potamilus streckersoni]